MLVLNSIFAYARSPHHLVALTDHTL